ASSSGSESFLSYDVADFVWSPIGTHLVYTTTSGSLWVASSSGSESFLSYDVADFVWSPDGTHLEYTTTSGTRRTVPVN
ncbi:MAG: hypothetical protein OXS29_17060, partial [bacterium]|nr:hypothetical protein [bacterium]MDE0437477.1 hypothetical protein [bacterium]